jgi:hypothetical protein
MSTLAKVEASRTNGKLSKGPKTANGKAVAKLNAVSHGLRSLSPVLPGERPKEWADHRAGIIAALAPVGTLEAELAERVALLLWRLRRVVRYETAVTTARIDQAVGEVRGEKDDDPLELALRPRHNPRTHARVQQELSNAYGDMIRCGVTGELVRQLVTQPPDHPINGSAAFRTMREIGAYTPNGDEEYTDIADHEFLAQIGVPAEWRDEAEWWGGWNVGIVRAGVRIIAADAGVTEAWLLERAEKESDRGAAVGRGKATQLENELATTKLMNAADERAARARSSLPAGDVVDKVTRYESHLNKQLTQTLHTLERLRAIRDGNPPAPPLALDVTVETTG